MVEPKLIHLKVFLPYRVFADESGISRIVARTQEGSFGMLPNRLDCITALVPGLFVYQIGQQQEVCIAVDEGVLVKTGSEVLVSVRNAIAGKSLSQLREAVEQDFLNLDDEEQNARSLMVGLESDFIRRFGEYQSE